MSFVSLLEYPSACSCINGVVNAFFTHLKEFYN